MKDTKQVVTFLVAIVAVFIVSSCGPSKTLTREKAKDLLEKTDQYQPHLAQVPTSIDELRVGIQKGLWTQVPAILGIGIRISPRGSNCFSEFDSYHNSLVSRVKIRRRVVEITGITDAPASIGAPGTAKLVDVKSSWDFNACNQPEVNDIFKDHVENDQILFRLYDDGWRPGS